MVILKRLIYIGKQNIVMEINEKIEECNNDKQKFLEKHSVDLARRKKLWEDFEKDENNKLEDIKKNFVSVFEMTEDDYEKFTKESQS